MRKQKKAIERLFFQLFLLVVLCTGPGLFSQEMEADTIGIEKTEYEPGEDLRIDYRCSEANMPYLWIGVFKRSVNEQMMQDAGLSIKILGELNASVQLNAPDTPGNYQVRLFSNQSGNISVHHRLDFEVKEKTDFQRTAAPSKTGKISTNTPARGAEVLQTGKDKLENYAGYQEGMVLALSDDKRFDIVGIHEEGSMVAIKLNHEKTWPHILAFKMNTTAPEFIVELGKNGYPLVARFAGHTIFYYNYTATTCDISVISPDSQIKSLKGVPVPELAELQKLKAIYHTSPEPQTTSRNGNTTDEIVNISPHRPLYNENCHGPCAGHDNFQDYYEQEAPTLGEKIGLRKPTGGELIGLSGNSYGVASCVLSGVFLGPAGAAVPCASAAVNIMQKVLPKKYKKIHLALTGLSTVFGYMEFTNPSKGIYGVLSKADTLFNGIGNAYDAHQSIKKSGGYIAYMKRAFGDEAPRRYKEFSYPAQLPEFTVNREKVPTRVTIMHLSVEPSSGNTTTVFKFSAAACRDKKYPSDSLEVKWDYGDGSGTSEWSTDKTASHKYSKEGTYTVKMQVRNKDNKINEATRTVTIEKGPKVLPETKQVPVPPTKCPKLEYVITPMASGRMREDDINEALNQTASKGYKLLFGVLGSGIFVKEENNNTIYPVKILKIGREDEDIKEINRCAKDNWVLVNAMFAIYMIQDKDAPRYEYKFLDTEHDFDEYKNQFPGGKVIDFLNEAGKQGWELVVMGDEALCRRIKDEPVKYEYMSFIFSWDNMLKFAPLGDQGWQYCTSPIIVKGQTGARPVILKRRVGKGDSFALKAILKNIANSRSKSILQLSGKTFKQMEAANAERAVIMQEYGKQGWLYKGLIRFGKSSSTGTMELFIFQVPKSCR